MAKREVNYFAKISSDEDFDKFLRHKALIGKKTRSSGCEKLLILVLDVHQDLFGPSLSLHGTLEIAKVSSFIDKCMEIFKENIRIFLGVSCRQ